MSRTVDLYLGSDIGKWVLSRVNPEHVGIVVSDEDDINAEAVRLGFKFASNSRPDTALSVHYHRLFTRVDLALYDRIYNLHPSFLPWGRGYYPMFWALYDKELIGASLHVVDEGVDTGPLIERIGYAASPGDTGDSVYRKVRELERDLFLRWWPHLVLNWGIPNPRPQQQFGGFYGSYHSKVSFDRIMAEKGDTPEVRRCLLSRYT